MDTPAEIFALITAELEKNPKQDFLGKLYMGSHWHGQFFTPYHISDFMAKITIGEETKDEIAKKGYVSVSDPCVGAGGMLIAAANAMREEGINYQTDALFVGQDIDRMVAMMAYIQMSLLGCPGYVIVGNSLTDPSNFHPLFPRDSKKLELWITPLFLFPAWEKRRRGLLEAAEKEGSGTEEKDTAMAPRIAAMEQRREEMEYGQSQQAPDAMAGPAEGKNISVGAAQEAAADAAMEGWLEAEPDMAAGGWLPVTDAEEIPFTAASDMAVGELQHHIWLWVNCRKQHHIWPWVNCQKQHHIWLWRYCRMQHRTWP